MPKESTSNRRKSGSRLLVSLGLLTGLVLLVDHNLLLAAFRSAHPGLLLASFALLPVQGIFESGRLRIVFASFGLSFFDSIRLFFIGMFFGNFMPGPIGTDVYQVYHMHTIRPGLLRPASLSIFLRLNGLLINMLLAAFAVAVGAMTWIESLEMHRAYPGHPAWLLAVAVAGLLLVIISIASPWVRGRLMAVRKKIRGLLREFYDSVTSFRLTQHISISVLGIFVVLLRVASTWLVLLAFGISIPYVDTIFIVTIATLAALLPIGFGGLGVREVSLTALLMAFGVDSAAAVAIALIGRSFIWALSLVGGVWFVVDQKKTHPNDA